MTFSFIAERHSYLLCYYYQKWVGIKHQHYDFLCRDCTEKLNKKVDLTLYLYKEICYINTSSYILMFCTI